MEQLLNFMEILLAVPKNPFSFYPIPSMTTLKLDAYTLAVWAVLDVCKNYGFTPDYIYNNVVPLRHIPFFVDHIGAPSFRNLSNPVTEDWVNLWRFNVGESLFLWLRVIKSFYERRLYKPHLEQSWDVFDTIFEEHIPVEVDRNSLLIPWVIPHHSPEGVHARCRMITITDYINLTNRSPSSFIIDLLQLIIFGLVIDQQTAQAMRIENSILSYVSSCLRQGTIDHYISRATYNDHEMTSSFDRIYRGSRTQEAYTRIGKSVHQYLGSSKSVFSKTRKMPAPPSYVTKPLSDVYHLGNQTDTFKSLAQLGAFSTPYNRYMLKRFPGQLQYYTPADFARHYNMNFMNDLVMDSVRSPDE